MIEDAGVTVLIDGACCDEPMLYITFCRERVGLFCESCHAWVGADTEVAVRTIPEVHTRDHGPDHWHSVEMLRLYLLHIHHDGC